MTRAGAVLFALGGIGVAILLTRKFREPAGHYASGWTPPDALAPTAEERALRGPSSPVLPVEAPPGGAVLRVVASESKKPVAGARWRIPRVDGTSRFEGTTDADGRCALTAEMLAAWEDRGLTAWGEERRQESFRTIPRMDEGVLELSLDRFHVDFEGVVVDEAGRPVDGAQVVVVYWSSVSSSLDTGEGDVFRTTTDARGRFRRSAKVWYPDAEGMDGHTLWVGGPGWVPVAIRPDKRGQRDLRVRLEPDREHGILDVEVALPDGKPARGTSVWIGSTPTVADERTSPGGRARREFAEVWRDRDDPRPAGSRTWAHVGGTERRTVWHHVVGEDGRRRVHPVPVGRTRIQALGEGSADVWVDVLPPPAVTPVALRLDPLRTVRGTVRVARDPSWPCRHEAHEHRVAVADWVDREWHAPFATGAFTIEGVPSSRGALRLSTSGHPDVVVALPAGEEGPEDLGVVEVPAARELTGLLKWPEGRRPEPWSTLRLEDDDGLVAEASTFWTADGGPRFTFVAPRPPGPGARILVRLRPSDGEASKVVRLDGPFDLGAATLLLELPPDTEGRKDGE